MLKVVPCWAAFGRVSSGEADFADVCRQSVPTFLIHTAVDGHRLRPTKYC